MPQQRWTREQELAVLYLRHTGVRQSDPRIEQLARAMDRTTGAVWMQKLDIDSLDLSVPGVGLQSASQLTKSVWSEYQRDPERTLAEAREAYSRLLSAETRISGVEDHSDFETLLGAGLSSSSRNVNNTPENRLESEQPFRPTWRRNAPARSG